MKFKFLFPLLLPGALFSQQSPGADDPVMVDTTLRSIGIGVSIPEIQAGFPALSESFDVDRFAHGPEIAYKGPR